MPKPFPMMWVNKLKGITNDTLEAEAAKDPLTKKVHDAFMAFRDTHREWAAVSEKPYHGIISSKDGMS